MRAWMLFVGLLIQSFCSTAQKTPFNAGFFSVELVDRSRIYKPDTEERDSLHYRPIVVDFWYPADTVTGNPLAFEDLFGLFEKRANQFQTEEDYTGLVEELAQFYLAELGMENDVNALLKIPTASYSVFVKAKSKFPVVLYLAGQNGMGFENYVLLEAMAERGFIVASIASVGRYPGDMTDQLEDMMEQVRDAEFVLEYLGQSQELNVDTNKIGVIGYSWGGLSGAVLAGRNNSIDAMVSLEGSENIYLNRGEVDANMLKILEADVLKKPTHPFSYLSLESDDRFVESFPIDSVIYYNRFDSIRYYLRMLNSVHINFSCIPYILKSSIVAQQAYQTIVSASIDFIEITLRGQSFDSAFEQLKRLPYTTDKPFYSKAISTDGIISGRVIDDQTKIPLPYVNVGILGKSHGTVTDREGRFSLRKGEFDVTDTLRFSMIGYSSVEFIVGEFLQRSGSVGLTEKVNQLEEIVVSAKAYHQKTLGNKTKSRFLSTGFGYDQLGAEIGIRIGVKEPFTMVDAFHFTVSHNRLSARSVFRLNFYEVVDGKPGVNILRDNILVSINPTEIGSKTIDLKKYNIVLTNDVFATLEWVDSEGDINMGEAIYFSLGVFNGGTIHKSASQANFKKYRNMGVGFSIDVRY